MPLARTTRQKLNKIGHRIMSLVDLPLEVLSGIAYTPEIYSSIRATSRAFINLKFTVDLDYYFYDSIREWKLPRAGWIDHIEKFLIAAPKFGGVYTVTCAYKFTYMRVFMIASLRDRKKLRAFIAATTI